MKKIKEAIGGRIWDVGTGITEFSSSLQLSASAFFNLKPKTVYSLSLFLLNPKSKPKKSYALTF